MRIYQISAGELEGFEISDGTISGYAIVRKAMTNANFPAYQRPCPHGTAGIPADTFDPIMAKTIDGMNKNNRSIYFMMGVTDVDLDDNKQPYCRSQAHTNKIKEAETRQTDDLGG